MNVSPEYEVRRQAIVVIHGIGEQKPNSTLRGFVLSLLGYEKTLPRKDDETPGYWVKPSQISDQLEIRRLVAAEFNGRAETDFFEYYWAPKIKGTSYRKIVYWLWPLLWRKSEQIPERLKIIIRAVKWFLRFLFVVLIIAVSDYLFHGYTRSFESLMPNDYWTEIFKWFWRIVAIAAVLFFVLCIWTVFKLNHFIKTAVGDAARYLRNAAENFELREKIRSEGVDFLLKLHDSKKYDRIMVIGHSLGSVIAYDILNHAWVRRYREMGFKEGQREKFKALINSMVKNPMDIDQFRDLQRQLWNMLREHEHPWLVSDFLSLGSPLSHGEYLLAASPEEFKRRIQDREFPTCPPVLDSTVPGKVSSDGEMSFYYDHMAVSRLHFAAPFAPVRWTNAYYTDDIIGGPINGVFGEYIKDEKLKSHWPLIKSHTHYWLTDEWMDMDINQDTDEYESLRFIYDSLSI